jgi:hypothetical protein
MPQERPNRLVEWWLLLKRQTPLMRQYVADWFAAVREEPYLIWQTPAIRYAVYGVGGLMLVWIVTGIVSAMVPPPPAGAQPRATTADFHVLCTNPSCGEHFVINRKFGFKAFPVKCIKCGLNTGYAARKCNSSTCRGRWVVPFKEEAVHKCPHCGKAFE